MNIHMHTFGCKLNQYESDEIKKNLSNLGYKHTSMEEADAVIINTCTVTKQSDDKLVFYLKNIAAGKKIFLVGCYVSKNDFEYENAVIIKNEDKERAHIIINEHLKKNKNTKKILPENSPSRASLKIQDGCSVFCSYCIVAHVRGKVRSMTLKDIVKSADDILKNGYKEIVLTGINIASYKHEETDFTSLIETLAEKLRAFGARLRLSSVEPFLFTDRLAELFSDPVICPHIHVPLQSASNKILYLMKRRYTKEDYKNIVQKLMKVNENIKFTTDVMVGFPSETEDDFNETLSFCREINFLKIHVFRYSKREGTEAYSFENQIPSRVKLARAKMITGINKENYERHKNEINGKTLSVIIEKESETNTYFGTSEQYFKVKVLSKKPLCKKTLVSGKAEIDGNDIIVKT